MSKQARILIIDDDPIVQQSCKRILAENYDVEVADTGQKGLAALETQSFHLILLDLKLPDMQGMDILREAPDRFPDVPVIIITGYPSTESAEETKRLGAVHYITKPFTPDKIADAVRDVLRPEDLQGWL